MHHGDVIVQHDLTAAIAEVVAWAAQNRDELVVVYVTDCDGDNCESLAEAVMVSNGIHASITDCTALQGLTLDSAKNISTLVGGGHVLAVFGCVDENYDPSIECYLPDGAVCYNPKTADRATSKLWAYMNQTTATPQDVQSGKLWMAQAHWQYSAESIAEGVLHESSILMDEARSSVNMLVSKGAAGMTV
jgi:hypothetical protein